jgi:hypothetical protein
MKMKTLRAGQSKPLINVHVAFCLCSYSRTRASDGAKPPALPACLPACLPALLPPAKYSEAHTTAATTTKKLAKLEFGIKQ